MNIGVPRERRVDEHRVGLTPAGVEMLSAAGHVCSFEKDAGHGAGFADVEYERAGGRIVYSGEEAYGRADLVVKVSKPTEDETKWLREGSILMGFLHLTAGRKDRVDAMLDQKVTANILWPIIGRDAQLYRRFEKGVTDYSGVCMQRLSGRMSLG